jgi:glycosyltransferase involved in cell wall biosynthesis
MTLLFISNEYPPDTGFGGIGTYTAHAAESLASRGHRVHVICRGTAKNNTTMVQRGVTVHRAVPGPYTLPSSKYWYPLRKLCYRLIPQTLVKLAWSKTVARTVAALKESDITFDIIECPECGAEGFFLSRFAEKLVVRLHTPWKMIGRLDDLPGPVTDVLFEDLIEKSTARRARAISSPTQALAKVMKKQWGLNRVDVYPNPIPAATYPSTAGGGWIYSGRIERRKGIETLLLAYAALLREHPLPKLTLIGRPYGFMKNGMEYGSFIKQMIAEKNLEAQVTWIPGVPTDRVVGFLTRSSVAFFPSLWENFPYACLEAMACGCAVVASRCGGFPEMIDDGISGLLFDSGDVQSLIRIMRRMVNESRLAQTLGETARTRIAARFDSATVCDVAENFYRSMLHEASDA